MRNPPDWYRREIRKGTRLQYCMKWFYELYPTAINLPQGGVEFAEEK